MQTTEPPAQVDTAPRGPGLSPTRAADFLSCPLLYRFRTLDRLPESRSRAAVRGTLVHAVLEQLYALPAAGRTVAAALALVGPAWAQLRQEPGVAALFGAPGDPGAPAGPGDTGGPAEGADVAGLADWLASAGALVETCFALEDPTRIRPAGREELIEVTLPDGLRLRGVPDRVDEARNGALRVVDYKTGARPHRPTGDAALFQVRFYALLLWRTRGVVPAQLRLLHLGSGDVVTHAPDAAELVAFEDTLRSLWAAITRAVASGDFPARPGPRCRWCDHRARCPSAGGTPPPFPTAALAEADWPTTGSPAVR